MIVFDKVHVRGLDGHEYTLNFRINPRTLNVIVTPALLDKRLIVKYIIGSSPPAKGRVLVDDGIRKIGIYDPDWKPPTLMRVKEYIVETAGSDDLFSYIAEQLGKLGVRIDEYTVFTDLPRPIASVITLFTTLSVPKDLYILIDPFEFLDEALLNLVVSIMRENVRKGGTVLVVTSNKTLARMFRFDQYIEVSKHELNIRTTIQRSIEIPEDCLIYEAIPGERGLENFIKSILELKGFRGVLMNERKTLILVEPKCRGPAVKILKKALDEGVFRRVRRIG